MPWKFGSPRLFHLVFSFQTLYGKDALVWVFCLSWLLTLKVGTEGRSRETHSEAKDRGVSELQYSAEAVKVAPEREVQIR